MVEYPGSPAEGWCNKQKRKSMNWTNKTPTEPGDYKWRENEEWDGIAMTLVLDQDDNSNKLVRVGDWEALPIPAYGEWCRLVPADELKKAYIEGWNAYPEPERSVLYSYAKSRAKRIAEGLKE